MLAVLVVALPASARAAPATGSCLFAAAGDPYDTLLLFDIRQKTVRVDIVGTDTGTVVGQVFAAGDFSSGAVLIEAGFVDATTEFVVYANNGKPYEGGSGKLLAVCDATVGA